MSRVGFGYFSLSARSVSGDDRPYLEWHQLDHMPEQYQLEGLVNGQRWAATSACREARSATGRWAEVEHVVCYLMGEPLEQTIDDFLDLGPRLAEMGRFPHHLPSRYRGGLRLLGAHASPRVLVGPDVVPFRPNRGIYLVVEEAGGDGWDAHLRRTHSEAVPELLSVDGVAGVWIFATTPAIRRANFSDGDLRIAVVYLDDDPVETAARLDRVFEPVWERAPRRPLLSGPYESMMRWDWDRFGPAT